MRFFYNLAWGISPPETREILNLRCLTLVVCRVLGRVIGIVVRKKTKKVFVNIYLYYKALRRLTTIALRTETLPAELS